jgi:hypothetical protein
MSAAERERESNTVYRTMEQTKALIEWAHALQSGDYAQGRKQLRSLNKETDTIEYCCMGVRHELSGGKWLTTGVNQDHYKAILVSGRSAAYSLEMADLDKVGLTSKDQGYLTAMNDVLEMSFYGIGEVVRCAAENSCNIKQALLDQIGIRSIA